MKGNLILTVVFAITLLPAGVRAQDSSPSQQPPAQPAGPARGRGERGACRQDVQKLCKGQKKGPVMSCLMANLDQLQNADCKTVVQNFKAKDDAVRAACASDIAANKCAGMDIGTGLLKCLGANRQTLSDGCKASMRDNRQGPKGRRGGGWGGRRGQGKGAGPGPAGGDQGGGQDAPQE